ncbi:hypothetical protein QJS10_CPB17g00730 [Acorus calamus]|uniref:Peptidase S54 rhomboid domain-containing protein n=1 Tax=Acorus calamus TaxID=4465 RepID=A0AAV9CWT2_ACOCL|nr:hypothetical protein QJS10_CPB17g00730 [Acorus calamus]
MEVAKSVFSELLWVPDCVGGFEGGFEEDPFENLEGEAYRCVPIPSEAAFSLCTPCLQQLLEEILDWRTQAQARIPALGASASVNAIILLDIFLHPRSIIYANFFIPVPSMLMGAFIIGHDLWRVMQGEREISGSAHLGGAAVAGLAWLRIRKGRF